MKIFMTGATGFIGSATARHLVDQGHDLTCVVRNREKAGDLADLGVTLVDGDLSDRARLAGQMTGSDAVVHNAALYEVGIPASRRPALYEANVTGTENTLGACLDTGIPRVLYVSTCAVFGNTHHQVADENFKRADLDFTSYYEETKYEAHQIALEMIDKQGLPCVIAQPAGVYGPGDHSAIASTVHQFIDGKLPMIPFPDFGTGLAHVDDIAAGLVLILDKGEIGECYILTEANHSMGDIVGTVARVAGKKAPKRSMPTGLLKMLRPVGPLVGKLMSQPPNLAELISSADNVTFWADASKARNQLGFRPRDLETGMRETIEAEGWLN
mgnify:FL=1